MSATNKAILKTTGELGMQFADWQEAVEGEKITWALGRFCIGLQELGRQTEMSKRDPSNEQD